MTKTWQQYYLLSTHASRYEHTLRASPSFLFNPHKPAVYARFALRAYATR